MNLRTMRQDEKELAGGFSDLDVKSKSSTVEIVEDMYTAMD